MYKEGEYITIGEISHYIYCPRQWALMYLEQKWKENVWTLEGHIMHNRVHNPFLKEKRGSTFLSRAMPVISKELGVVGECDAVEFVADPTGIYIPAYKETYNIFPVEYKRGHPKEDTGDVWQLTAQALCLEEMLFTSIPIGYIYYGEIRRRITVEITDEKKNHIKKVVEEIRNYTAKGHTPSVKRRTGCKGCSIEEYCIPSLRKTSSVSQYLQERREE